jgi:hypothetical protein
VKFLPPVDRHLISHVQPDLSNDGQRLTASGLNPRKPLRQTRGNARGLTRRLAAGPDAELVPSRWPPDRAVDPTRRSGETSFEEEAAGAREATAAAQVSGQGGVHVPVEIEGGYGGPLNPLACGGRHARNLNT